jgi:hypothetical protein
MDDAPQNVVPGKHCPRCYTPADDGLIFCRNCAAALRLPLPLTQFAQDAKGSSDAKSLARQIVVVVLKGFAGIAAVIAVLCPLSTFTEIFVFVASIAVACVCYLLLTHLDETHVDEYGKDGYWPKPLDWNAPPKNHGSAQEDVAAK